jgi:hypothetical protein
VVVIQGRRAVLEIVRIPSICRAHVPPASAKRLAHLVAASGAPVALAVDRALPEAPAESAPSVTTRKRLVTSA